MQCIIILIYILLKQAESKKSYSLWYLKIKMKSISNMQKVATLSIVFIRTTSWRRRAGMKRTSFSTRSSRKVRSTERPPSDWPMISQTLQEHHKEKNYKQQYCTVKALSGLVSYRSSHHLSPKRVVYLPATFLLPKNTFTSQCADTHPHAQTISFIAGFLIL